MRDIRFVILGAGNIAGTMCGAISRIPHCEAAAVASKSLERARDFAERNHLPRYYDDYETMLEEEKPDCAYIAVLPNDHYRLTKMCIEHGVAVLCEKAMFQNSMEARDAFALAREKQVFVMEALWSRFLPAVQKVRQWLEKGCIGNPETLQISIGFVAPPDPNNRYMNPALGGGAAKDIMCYAYEITTYVLQQPIKSMAVSASWGPTGVDLTDHVSITFEHTLADLMVSFAASMEQRMVVCGPKGRIVLPAPHFASECFLYNAKGELEEHFKDEETVDGFAYEVSEVIRCLQEGAIESPVVPHEETLACAKVFDEIEGTKPHGI